MAGFSVALLVLAGVVTWLVLRPDTYVAPTPSVERPVASPAGAARTLQRLQEAVTGLDGASAAALAPVSDDRSSDLLSAVVDNARSLRVRRFTLRYVDRAGAVRADGSWQAAVDMTWAFRGFDRAPAHEEVLVDFRTDGDRTAITGFGGGDRRTPLWLTGPLVVERTPGTLVLVDGTRAEADRYSGLARTAVPIVRRVLPRWRTGLVVEVPSSLDELNSVLDAEPGDYDNIAAVTATVDGSLAPDAPVHVFVNPGVFDALEPQGSQVVMSHEATHAATDAATAALPVWLVEGFADYVALRDVALPLTTTAGQIIAQVRKDGVPQALPGPTEFDESSTHLGAAYEAAWLVCRVLADRGGERALVRLYERVRDGADLAPTLRREFGLGVPALTRLWQQRLRDISAGTA